MLDGERTPGQPKINIPHSVFYGNLVGTLTVDRFTHLLTRFNDADHAGDYAFGELSQALPEN
jgi:hypothetical protein